jgi:hypothetical protein
LSIPSSSSKGNNPRVETPGTKIGGRQEFSEVGTLLRQSVGAGMGLIQITAVIHQKNKEASLQSALAGIHLMIPEEE